LNFILDIPVQSNENPIPIKMIENSTISIQLITPQSGRIKRQHFAILILIFLISISSLCIVYILFPKIDPYVKINLSKNLILSFFFSSTEKEAFKIPKTIDDAKILGNVLYKYSKHHRYIIMIAFFLTYIL
jgi:hypothetical protein